MKARFASEILPVAFVVTCFLGLFLLVSQIVMYCNSRDQHTPIPSVIAICDDPDLQPAAVMWQNEVHRRFSNAVILVAHGQDINGEFYCFPNGTLEGGIRVVDEIKVLQAEYAGRTICFLACNPQHIVLHGYPNVYYSSSETWVIPDRDVLDAGVSEEQLTAKMQDDEGGPVAPENRWAESPDVTGNVFEMLEAR